MNVLVTGANGFIASTLIEALVEKGVNVTAIVRPASQTLWIQDIDIKIVRFDWNQPDDLNRLVVQQDVVFHLAGVTKGRNYSDFWQGNVETTRILLESCEKYGPPTQRVVFVSSQAAAGPSFDGVPLTEESVPQPISMYGKSKLEAETLVQDFSAKKFAIIVRPPSVYGPRDRDIFMYLKSISKGIIPVFDDGTQQVSIIHVSDLVAGLLLAAFHSKTSGRVYFLSGDQFFNALELLDSLKNIVNRKKIVIHVPFWGLDVASWSNIFWSWLRRRPALLNRDKIREIKYKSWLISNQRAKNELGFNPKIELVNGLISTFRWYQNQGWL